MKKFPEYQNFNLSDINKTVLAEWEENDVFHQSIEQREVAPSFVFYEGPPSANGMPGIHHVMSRTIKDIFCRYKTMQGYQVKRKAGWDTHGLPVELGVEKSLGITKEDIGKKITIEEYNAACRTEVMKYTKEWETLTRLMGYWVDMENPYITYDNKYIETLWWLLKQLYNKDLLYKGYTIQPYSPAAGTGLSSHELNQPGCYRDVKDRTVVAQFKAKNVENTYFLAWTTTPWTLPSNTALAVGKDIDYLLVRTFNPSNFQPIIVIVAEMIYLKNFFGLHLQYDQWLQAEITNHNKYEHIISDWVLDGKINNNVHYDIIMNDFMNETLDNGMKYKRPLPYYPIKKLKGSDLVGMEYEQLIPFVKPDVELYQKPIFSQKYKENAKKTKFWTLIISVSHSIRRYFAGFVCSKNAFETVSPNAFRVISGDFVTTEDGTGIVHIAPTFGADDDKVAKQSGIVPLLLTDKNGKQVPMVDLTGKFYKIEDLDNDFVKKNVNVELYKNYAGKFVKDAYYKQLTENHKSLDDEICIWLKEQGLLFKSEKHTHNYPHCWRTDKPVLYYPLDSWFIKTTEVKDEMIALNNTINWKPQSTGTGRFGKWLENLNDWNLSRSRYWGTPLPIWRTEDGTEEICIGSMEELFAEIEKSVSAGVMSENPFPNFKVGDYSTENYAVENIDLHRPYVDNIILVSKSGKPMKRELDLIDVWFDSGAMPFAQVHYPFECEK